MVQFQLFLVMESITRTAVHVGAVPHASECKEATLYSRRIKILLCGPYFNK